MLSSSSYVLAVVAALLVTCHALCKCPGTSGLPGSDALKGWRLLPGLRGPSGSWMGPPGKDCLSWLQSEKGEIGTLDHPLKKADVHTKFCQPKGLSLMGLPDHLDTDFHNDLQNLQHQLSRLEGVLALNGKIKEVGDKIFASNGKEVDFASALESCEEAGGTLATPTNEEENKAILDIVKQYNRYAYLGIKEGEISGQFNYINGTPLNYTKWHKNEPNGKGTENCVEMYTDGSWNDKKCNLYRLTICEF